MIHKGMMMYVVMNIISDVNVTVTAIVKVYLEMLYVMTQ